MKNLMDISLDTIYWSWARFQAKTGKSKAYLYYFDQHPDYPKDSPKYSSGSPHAQEVP